MTLVKTIIYRLYSFVILFLFAFFITHNFDGAFKISLGLEAIKLAQYFIFEKIWAKLFV